MDGVVYILVYFIDIVCAKFSADGRWYRAEIVRVVTSENIRIRFVDYGNEEEVNRRNINPFSNSLLKYRVFAVKCGLHPSKGRLQKVVGALHVQGTQRKEGKVI